MFSKKSDRLQAYKKFCKAAWLSLTIWDFFSENFFSNGYTRFLAPSLKFYLNAFAKFPQILIDKEQTTMFESVKVFFKQATKLVVSYGFNLVTLVSLASS